jgi:histidinol-phosphatase
VSSDVGVRVPPLAHPLSHERRWDRYGCDAMPRDFSDELDFARELARVGGSTAMAHFGRNPQTKKKPDGTWVTEGDWAAESEMRLRIGATFPEHNILGEEEGLTSAGGGPAVDGAPTWVLDPIDGTHNFMAGIPIWATLVALAKDGEALLGVCHAPALDETYEAARGGGALMNGAAIRVDPITDMSATTLLASGLESFEEAGLAAFYTELVRRSWRSRGFADFWGHMLVARGAAHVMAETVVNVWDYAALEPIVVEAGGHMSQFGGAPLSDGGSALTTNGVLHEEVVALARRHLQPK